MRDCDLPDLLSVRRWCDAHCASTAALDCFDSPVCYRTVNTHLHCPCGSRKTISRSHGSAPHSPPAPERGRASASTSRTLQIYLSSQLSSLIADFRCSRAVLGYQAEHPGFEQRHDSRQPGPSADTERQCKTRMGGSLASLDNYHPEALDRRAASFRSGVASP